MKVSGPLEMKKQRWALWLTSLHHRLLRPLFKEDKPRWSRHHARFRKKKPSRKTHTAGAHGTECQRSDEGSRKLRDLQGSQGGFSDDQHGCVSNWPEARKETHLKKLRKSQLSPKVQEVCLFPSMTENLKMHRTLGRIGFCLSGKEKWALAWYYSGHLLTHIKQNSRGKTCIK